MAIQSSFKRYEKKYMLTPEQYKNVLAGLLPYMTADAFAKYTICNIYYDTDDFRLIRASIEKPLYKEKLRVRSYGVPSDNDNTFVEIKKKFDGVVYKRRITLPAKVTPRYLAGEQKSPKESQISREIDYFLTSYPLEPKVFIAYDREAYAGIDNPDLRVTFDTNLRWRDTELDLRLGDYGAPILPPDKILMEIKIPGTAPLWLARLLSENHVFSSSFSKYGTCYKQNILGRVSLERLQRDNARNENTKNNNKKHRDYNKKKEAYIYA